MASSRPAPGGDVRAKSLGNVGGDAPAAFSPEVIYGTPVADRFDLEATGVMLPQFAEIASWSQQSMNSR